MRFIGRRASRPKRDLEEGKPEASKVGEVTERREEEEKGKEKRRRARRREGQREGK